MKHTVTFTARGHPNIRSRHRTTLMTTTESELSTRGDCIIAVSAEIGLSQLPEEIKNLARDSDTKITFALTTGNHTFTAVGKGDPRLTYANPVDMVARKSNYICDRTLMVSSDKAAVNLPKELVDELQDSETELIIQLSYETPEIQFTQLKQF